MEIASSTRPTSAWRIRRVLSDSKVMISGGLAVEVLWREWCLGLSGGEAVDATESLIILSLTNGSLLDLAAFYNWLQLFLLDSNCF